MNKCLFCNEETNRPKYCSTICMKRAWYLRKNPNSYFSGNPNFWKTETGIGFKWEIAGAKLLGAKHLIFNKMGADLDWNGKMVDVKSCHLNKRKNKRGNPVKSEQMGCWTFNRGKNKQIDFFLCYCLVGEKAIKILLIPDEEFGESAIMVGHQSKFDKFTIS